MFVTVKTKYVCGIDLHAYTMSVCIMDKNGKVLVRKSIKCEIDLLMNILKPYHRSITVGVESTFNWYWLLDGLKQQKLSCHLGHALYIKRMSGNKHKNDSVDARGIADLLRTNRFPLAYDYPSEMRGTRDLLRRRHSFVRRRAGTYTHLQNTLNSHGFTKPFRADVRRKGDRRTLEKLPRQKDVGKNIGCDLDYIDSLDVIINDLEKTVIASAHHHNRKHFKILHTMPGVGKITALTVLYETHTVARFKNVQCYSSYCRVVQASNESCGTSYGRSSNDKIGNPYLKWAFSEIGIKMVDQSKLIGEWFKKQVDKHGKGGAMARLRHKIAIAVYYIIKHEIVFDEYKFLGIEQSRTVTPAHDGTDTSGKKSKPSSSVNGKPSGSFKKKVIVEKKTPVKKKTPPKCLSLRKAVYKKQPKAGYKTLKEQRDTTGKRKILTKK